MTVRNEQRVGFLSQLRAVVGNQGRLKWVVLILLALAISVMEIMAAALVYLLLERVTTPSATVDLPIIGDPIRFLGGYTDDQVIYFLTAGIAAFFVFRAAALVFQRYVQARVVYRSCASVSTRLTREYLAMPYAEHLKRNSAELVRNAFFNVQVLTKLLSSAVKVLAEVLVVVGLIAAMVLIEPIVTLVAVLVMGPSMFLLLWLVKTRMKAYGHGIKETEREGLVIVQEGLSGIRDIRILGAERWFSRSFSRTRNEQANYMVRHAAVDEVPRVAIETLLVFMIAGFFALVTALSASEAGTLSTLGLFAYVGVRLKPSIQAIMAGVNNVRHNMPSLGDITKDLQTLSERRKQGAAEKKRANPVPNLERDIELSGVGYIYDGSPLPALADVDLKIEKGMSLGIVGPTGGGKSTLVDVIAGLLPPSSGELLVDGVDVHRSDLATWYRQLGVVSQSIFMMDATIRENIALGVDAKDVDDESVRSAVRLAQLENFIEELPQGLETRLGERGSRLSGGQMQRVAIARALYRKPEVLILDEGTAALDNKTEADLVDALEELHGKMTLIVVAHRLSTVRHCDNVVIVEHGHIADSGTYEQLFHRHPIFAALRSGTG